MDANRAFVFSCIPKVGLDPRVAVYITDVELGGLLSVPDIDLDYALIIVLVERWRPETAPEDALEYLPHAMLCRTRLKLCWLETMCNDPLLAGATGLQVQQYARYYILEMLGGMVSMDKSSNQISVMYLQFLNPISNGKKYSWGSVA
ncbi:hypothetical protein SO802_023169 [Lithocarpus litseifolius]|uniref:Uncharacterized protein n=1 Tax=Lithocarpus litseifolius TaxID=425828 RepID=A0AAW2C5I2_9ROSI